MLYLTLKLCYILTITMKMVRSESTYDTDQIADTHSQELLIDSGEQYPDEHQDRVYENPISELKPIRSVQISMADLLEMLKDKIVDDIQLPKRRQTWPRGQQKRYQKQKNSPAFGLRNKNFQKNENVVKKQQKIPEMPDNDYAEPESVPAPKHEGKSPKSGVYETIRIQSKKGKDSYEDYIIPPKEYDVYATVEDEKENKKKQEELRDQGEFVGETLGGDTENDQTPNKGDRRPNNDDKRGGQKKRQPQNQGQLTGETLDDTEDRPKAKQIKNIILQRKKPGNRQKINPNPIKNKNNIKLLDPVIEPESNNEPTIGSNQQRNHKIHKIAKKKEDYDGPQEQGVNMKETKASSRDNPRSYNDRFCVVRIKTFLRPHPGHWSTEEVCLQYVFSSNWNGSNHVLPVNRRTNLQNDNNDEAEKQNVQENHEDDQPLDKTEQENPCNDRPVKSETPNIRQGQNNPKRQQRPKSWKSKPQPEEQAEYNVYEDEPQSTTPGDFGVKTENIGDDDYENDSPTRRQKKSTGVPTRHLFSQITPDYYNKQPKVAEKHDFNEPLPEEDRTLENTKDWLGPPSRVNNKQS